ncbi:VrrA/YqfQ family protein [Peribacillus sp. NPDC097264]|uniref:VrrA/YqfQ family protein n=1 Tax=unclassified Peribacillus TaxID=2675266 RepID=UPI00381C698F
MFQDRNRSPGPGFQQPNNGPRMQQPRPFRGPQYPNSNPFQPMRPPQGRPQGPPGPQQGFRGGAPFNQQQRPEQQLPKKEGILAKLLGRSKQQNAAPPNLFAPANSTTTSSSRSSGGGILENLTKPDSLNNMLNNTQKVLQAAEQFTPMVQQYGPVIKNLPSMWKVFRSISSSEETEKPAEENTNLTTSPKIQEPEPAVNSDKPKIELNVEPAAEALPKKTRNRSSGPKLYI